MKRNLLLAIILLPLFTVFSNPVFAEMQCSPGYEYKPRSGVDCVQIDCNSITDAHYGSTGYCVCGSSGSIYENPKDANQECSFDRDFKGCPGCVYACVGVNDTCPDVKKAESEKVRCVNHCEKYLRLGGSQSEVLQVSGNFPDCECTVDLKNDLGQITGTITLEKGDKETTYTFDPTSGILKNKETKSLMEEREKIREKLKFKYTQEEMDEKIDPDRISEWFQGEMKDIKTSTSWFSASFWTQHIMAMLDHGFGNDPDFVDIHQYGRCGDSMLWLERNLSYKLDLGEKKQEAFLSITGENYGNITNHTAIVIRPQGIDNLTWAESVNTLVKESGGNGLNGSKIKNIDERILKAKVIDPYFRTETTVEKFIKGWSVVRIS